MSGQWAGSDRHSTLPAGWSRIRRVVMTRDGHRCTWLANHDDGGPGIYATGAYDPGQRCPSMATDVDHVRDPTDHRPANLRALCGRHHNARSSKQGNETKTRRAALRYRPPQPHPGLRQP
jgi:5-methylcytosine-specific restriction enzyme A